MKIIKFLQSILSYIIFSGSMILFVPAILLYVLHFFVDSPKLFITNMKALVDAVKKMKQV
jgi:hypothetical protein